MLMTDAAVREMIRTDLDKNLVIEAAAGTGKTTELVRRIVRALAEGRARVDSLAAVTFTEKAAGELKLRLRSGLEEARRAAPAGSAQHRSLEAALARLEEARVGTIHGFCADLLRERSVEARVDPRFETLPEGEDRRVWAAAFDRWLEDQLESPPEGVRRSLRRIPRGQDDDGPVGRLRNAGWTLAEWRDFPAPWRRDPLDREAAIEAVVAELHSFADLSARCADKKRDRFYLDTDSARVASREIRAAEDVAPRDLDGVEGALVDLLRWPFRNPRRGSGKAFGEGVAREDVLEAHAALLASLEGFARAADADLAALLRDELTEAIERYEDSKGRSGRLDFVDLLLRVRDLVRDHAEVRAEFQKRFTHLFVDEFQDTDPLQAEILLLLAADDPRESEWRRVTPAPGKLFLVADPKQSIYRFRRADVGTYLDVRDLLAARGAVVGHLSTSFRAVPSIQRAVNAAFASCMQESAPVQQAGYVALGESRREHEEHPAIVALPVPSPYGDYGRYTKKAIEASLPEAVGAFVHWLVEKSGWEVTERGVAAATVDSERAEKRVPIAARHVCILFRRLENWGDDVARPYVEALEARNVRHLLVGGRSFHEREEVESLRVALAAIEWPDDELSVFATLRGAFFAVGDESLLEWRHRFHRVHPFRIPDEVPGRLRHVSSALELLGALHRERNRRPIADTVNRLLESTRAHAALVMRPSGEQALANVLHLAEQARDYEAAGGISFRGFVQRLLEEAGARRAGEAPILEEGSDGVRIMTVHKAKGLEFPVVVLADPTATLARDRPSRVLRPERRLAAMRIAGWAPADLLDHADEEVERDVQEGVRVAYVAATRARDLLVVPTMGDGPFLEMSLGARASWIAPLFPALYPPRERWVAGETAPSCPRFGKDSVVNRPHDPGGALSVRPGWHRFDGWSVAWWDPHVLDLGADPAPGVRREHLLAKDIDPEIIDADVREHRAWREDREALVTRASRPGMRVETAGARARRDGSGHGGSFEIQQVSLARRAKRPTGARFGSLVHAVLAAAPLEADADGVRSVAELQRRVLGATPAESSAAARIAADVLKHPVLERAREAARRGECRRETPVTQRDAGGVIVEGVVDLAFREGGEWTVVDFKTDADVAAVVNVYREQIRLYASAIAAATGEPVRGVLFTV
jgi:ATP-dependent exoDNAse (exonuclease V) beta subunit